MPRSSSPPHADAAPRDWTERGALVLAAGTVMGLALGVRHVQGLFLLPVTMEHGWSRESFAFAMAVQNLVWGLAQPFAGMVADRWGSARVVAAGLVLYALGLLGMARAGTPFMFVMAAGVCIGVALSGTSFGVVYGALSRLVAPAQRGRTLGLAGAAGGLGQFLLVPAVQGLLGWGTSLALLLLAALLALALPFALPLRERSHACLAAAPAQPLGQAVREAFAHPGFWLLNLGFLACGFQLAFIATHLPAYLLDQGLAAADGMLALAVIALAVIALANVIGTYAFGRLGDAHSKKSLLAGIYLARTAAMALFLLLPLNTLSLCVFAGAMGFLWLGTVPLTSGIVTQVFGVRYTVTLFGFVFLGHQLGAFLGVWLGGYVFETTHAYDWLWRGAMGLGLLAAALHWRIDEHPIVRAPLRRGRA